ncbi:hypothetical protein C2G38_823391 [Gigaspora rosea]|uniref:Uncharacterized protein n=1 Tax=Gigaspora rosea TaxID=44941 RepID=A0A397U6Q9_9GLOM|nr:hypothetical protein C2G38_823391 [Gigaspora rosea]
MLDPLNIRVSIQIITISHYCITRSGYEYSEVPSTRSGYEYSEVPSTKSCYKYSKFQVQNLVMSTRSSKYEIWLRVLEVPSMKSGYEYSKFQV